MTQQNAILFTITVNWHLGSLHIAYNSLIHRLCIYRSTIFCLSDDRISFRSSDFNFVNYHRYRLICSLYYRRFWYIKILFKYYQIDREDKILYTDYCVKIYAPSSENNIFNVAIEEIHPGRKDHVNDP